MDNIRDKIYSLNESAEVLNKKRTFLYDLLKAGIIESVTIGQHKYFYIEDIERIRVKGLTFSETEELRAYRREQQKKCREAEPKPKSLKKKIVKKVRKFFS